ncbi:chemotaxis signal transduction protein [Limnobacter thiooxidans]|uniref:CheW-like domain-containing protein n=1 Tax=Limnobacter thiooxidans TaxID=131080 RepID=A0AA86J491_9BURK|nr:chemotaxis signal transduction protein [Limnobacter thiooxidans]BET26964.1 hypothetical protein RGQ30_24650 [Limnobacter thiooxidans]
MNTQTQLQGYGAFRVHDMNLAMPMEHLREVLPVCEFQAMPGVQPWIRGGLVVRGVTIPVIDLLALSGRECQQGAQDCVVLIEFEGRLTGLLASAVGGLFFSNPLDMTPLLSGDAVGKLIQGSLRPAPDTAPLLVMSCRALFELPGLSAVKDPEPHRQALFMTDPATATQANALATLDTLSLLLMKSGGLLYAINPSDIETTIARPQLLPAEMAQGFYKGNVPYRGRLIPAVELSEYLDMGRSAVGTTNKQAIVICYKEGAMALLIDQILDIVRIPASAQIGLPRVQAVRPGNVCKVVPASQVYDSETDASHYFVLEASGFLNDTGLKDLARVIHLAELDKSPTVQTGNALDPAAPRDERVILFEMDQPYAVHIEQVSEVLPYRGVVQAFAAGQALKGFITHRGQAIPVTDLAQHMGLARQSLNETSNVLVVDHGGQKTGFAVGELKAIEHALWSPKIPVLGTQRTERTVARENQQLVEVMLQGQKNLVELIDFNLQANRTLQQGERHPLEPTQMLDTPKIDHSGGMTKYTA